MGSVGETCDLMTGQCRCKPGVTGPKCDKCAPQHYGFSEEGCKQCRVCPARGQVCDPVTGDVRIQFFAEFKRCILVRLSTKYSWRNV